MGVEVVALVPVHHQAPGRSRTLPDVKRAASSIEVGTVLITGLVMLVLTPATALASRGWCPGSISAPDTARVGSSFAVTATAVQGGNFEVFLHGGEGGSFLASGSATNFGTFSVTVTVPANFSTGGATVVMDMTTGPACDYGTPITILPKLIIIPGVTITISPVLTSSTTPAPQSSAATTAVSVSTSTSTDGLAETTTSTGMEATILDSTPTSLVTAAPSADSGGGQPWSAWITGGLIGLMLGGAGMLALIRKGVLKV